MIGMNKVILMGIAGNTPEIKQTGQKVSVLNFYLTTLDKWVDRTGSPQERAEHHRIVVWGKLALTAEQSICKGDKVLVEGRLQTRQWENNGEKRYTTEIMATEVRVLGDTRTINNKNTYDVEYIK